MPLYPHGTRSTTTSTDNGIPRFDGTTGKLIQSSSNVVIDDNGNVGIGTTGPGAKLHVVGNQFISSGILYVNTLLGYNGGATPLTIGDGTFNVVMNGNVGIGTTGPAAPLDVRIAANNGSIQNLQYLINPGSGNGTGAQLALGYSSAASTQYSALQGYYDSSISGMKVALVAGGTTVLTGDKNGNVGIGTTGPGAKLHVVGNQFISSGILYVNTLLGYNGGATPLTIGDGTFNVVMNGNVGIGTTGPGSALHVVGGEIRLQNNNSFYSAYSTAGVRLGYMQWNISNGNLIINNENSGGISLLTVGSEKVTITSTGNVGIGTTAPTISDGIGLHLSGKIIRIGTSKTPATSGATGNTGEICWDASYIYVCTATNTWVRAALATW